jgi:hypothetical protein
MPVRFGNFLLKRDRFTCIKHLFLYSKTLRLIISELFISDAGAPVEAGVGAERPMQVDHCPALHQQVRDRQQGQMHPGTNLIKTSFRHQ